MQRFNSLKNFDIIFQNCVSVRFQMQRYTKKNVVQIFLSCVILVFICAVHKYTVWRNYIKFFNC